MSKVSNTGWNMAGSEQSGEYRVFARSARGRVGVRYLGLGQVRIRLEPAMKLKEATLGVWKGELPRSAGYKLPGDDGQPRFSIVVPAGEYGDAVLEMIYGLLGKDELKNFRFNPDLTALSTAASIAA